MLQSSARTINKIFDLLIALGTKKWSSAQQNLANASRQNLRAKLNCFNSHTKKEIMHICSQVTQGNAFEAFSWSPLAGLSMEGKLPQFEKKVTQEKSTYSKPASSRGKKEFQIVSLQTWKINKIIHYVSMSDNKTTLWKWRMIIAVNFPI